MKKHFVYEEYKYELMKKSSTYEEAFNFIYIKFQIDSMMTFHDLLQ